MMNYEKDYNEVIGTCDEGYKLTIEDFKEWLEEDTRMDIFKKDLKTIEEEKDLYMVAFDYSIPVIMVKWFNRK